MWGLGILKGMLITMRNMLRGSITVQYPDERVELPERARWAVVPKFDETGAPKCTACMNCVRACPDEILALGVTTAEDKTKHIDEFTYEVGACMLCGLCVEACPFDALEMSGEYELAVTDPEELTQVLLHDIDAASPRRAKAAAQKRPRSAEEPQRAGAEEAGTAPTPEESPAGETAGATPPAEPADGDARAEDGDRDGKERHDG